MTEEQFDKTSFKQGMLIEFIYGLNDPVLCWLCEVDFVHKILTICPIDNPRQLENNYQVNIKYCTIHDKKIKRLTPSD